MLGQGGDIYMSFDWCRLWWEHYGQGRRLRIYLFREGDRLVAVLPFCIERVWLGPVWLNVAKLVGADSSLTLCQPPVRPEHAQAVLSAVLRDLLQGGHCEAVSFGPISATCGILDDIRRAAAAVSDIAELARDREIGVHTSFDLPESFQAYLSALSKNRRKHFRRQMKLLHSGRSVQFETVWDPERGLAEFHAMRELHESQWRSTGKAGHFGDWPGSVAFNAALVQRMAELGRLRIYKFASDGRPISYRYCFRFGGRLFARLPTRVVGPDWDKVGLGGLGVATMVEQAIAEDITEIEAGMGNYAYKLQWGATQHPIRSLLLLSRRLGSQARGFSFTRLADLLHLLYYRLWYLRLAPKVPAFRRPLARSWIRSRL